MNGRYSSQMNIDLDNIDFRELIRIEYSEIYWYSQDKRKPLSEFTLVLSPEIKKVILSYLRSGAVWAAVPGMMKDDKTGKHIPGKWLCYTDGKYSWESKTIYQFDKYDMKLPDDFISHILSKLETESMI